MAKPRRGKKFRIRFELSVTGLLGLGMVAFCIFLWMFLLGVWAGQTVLLPESKHPGSSPGLAELLHKGQEQKEPPVKVTNIPAIDDGKKLSVDSRLGEPSFFSLQVAAYSEAARASRAAAEWRQSGIDAFSLPPAEGGDGLYRVCVGKFENLAEANREASRLEETEDIRSFITLVPAGRIQREMTE